MHANRTASTNLPLVGVFVRILHVPERLLLPLIVAICVIGTYAVNFSAFDLQVMTLLGLVAYYMRKNDYPLGPAILGLVLGDLMEQNLRRSLIMSRTGAMIFFTRPLTAVLIALSVLSIFAPALLRALRPRRTPV